MGIKKIEGSLNVTGEIQNNGTSLGGIYESASNKVTTLSNLSTNIEYPSAKVVYDQLQLKQDTLSTATSSVAGIVKSSTTGTTPNRDYNVEVNNDGTMKVNVPWEGSSYETATTTDINRLFETEYTITTSVTNGSYTGSATIWSGETATITVTADTDYNLPASIAVTGASYTYDSSTGVISLSNATSNVSISVVCESAGPSLVGTTWQIASTNCTAGYGKFNINYMYNSDVTEQSQLGIGYLYQPREGWLLSADSVTTFSSLYTIQIGDIITITGGTDATNQDLIAWLQDNAVQIVVDVEPPEPTDPGSGSN